MKFTEESKILKSSQLLLLTLLCIVSVVVTAYTIQAHSIANCYIYDSGDEVAWRNSPPGSFFPWPKEPTLGMLPVLSKINEMDLFIYRYLIRTWLLVIVALSLWIATCTYVIKRVHRRM